MYFQKDLSEEVRPILTVDGIIPWDRVSVWIESQGGGGPAED